MDSEIHIRLQFFKPEDLHDLVKPFVRYRSEIKSTDGQPALIVGINVDGKKKKMESGTWALVHAIIKRGTQGADVDLEAISLRRIKKIKRVKDEDRHDPGIVLANGISDYTCVGENGRWLLVRIGVEEETAWCVA